MFMDETKPPRIEKPPKQAEETAPKVAPEEMPKSPGSASGFLKNIWNTAPLPARRAPDRRTSTERGSLKYLIKKKVGGSAPKKRLTQKERTRTKIKMSIFKNVPVLFFIKFYFRSSDKVSAASRMRGPGRLKISSLTL